MLKKFRPLVGTSEKSLVPIFIKPELKEAAVAPPKKASFFRYAPRLAPLVKGERANEVGEGIPCGIVAFISLGKMNH